MSSNLKKYLTTAFVVIALAGCGGNGSMVEKNQYDAIVAERDSLAQLAVADRDTLTELTGYLTEVARCVDSISTQEGLLALKIDPETGRRYTRREIIARINQFSQLIKRQREQIALLNEIGRAHV